MNDGDGAMDGPWCDDPLRLLSWATATERRTVAPRVRCDPGIECRGDERGGRPRRARPAEGPSDNGNPFPMTIWMGAMT